MGHEQGESTVLVVGDDAELGQLIALNLRQRGLVADYAGLATAQAARWSPSVRDPALLIIDLENPEQVSPAHLHRLARQPWAERTTFLLALKTPGPWSRRSDEGRIWSSRAPPPWQTSSPLRVFSCATRQSTESDLIYFLMRIM